MVDQIVAEEPEVDVEDEEMPLDELEEGEELVTEIPVHGVAVIEGRATGDGRGFRFGALEIGAMPQPLGYEYTSTHGGDTSNVAVVGRIDEYERYELEDGVAELRWRGVIMPAKPYASQAIDGIIDGSYTGLSVIVDSIEVDVDDQKSKMLERLTAQAEDKALDEMTPEELNTFVDEMVGDGTIDVTWFRAARQRRFDMVPTGAFQEGYIALGHEFADELDEDALAASAAALEDCGCVESQALAEGLIASAVWAEAFRDVSAEERKKLADEGKALPDGSFPIANISDLRNAIQAVGRASDPEAARAHIKKRAKALGREDLVPEDWAAETWIYDLSELTADEVEQYEAFADEDEQRLWMLTEHREAVIASGFAPGTKDGPGWITHPIPTARIRRYWVRGKGAAKIRWGMPGDFNRCRMQLAKYVQNPDWLAGLCANMHKEAIGVWPGQETGGRHSLVASADAGPLFTLVAAAAPVDRRLFDEPVFSGPEGIKIDGDRITGYIAVWNVCHIGNPEGPGRCTLAPRSTTNYAWFRTGTVNTTEGPVAVGNITMNTGHANPFQSAAAAASHYDNTGTVIADVACGENAWGIWFSGRVRPGVSEDDLYAVLASGRISGDWRPVGAGRELVAGLVVNVAGFPMPNPALVASADGVQAIIGEGIYEPIVASAAPTDGETIISSDLLLDVATLAVERYVQRQERDTLLERAAAARAGVQKLALARARAGLAEISR
jgi:hypothetical protein